MVPLWVTDIPLPKSPCPPSQDVSVLLLDGLTAFFVLLSPYHKGCLGQILTCHYQQTYCVPYEAHINVFSLSPSFLSYNPSPSFPCPSLLLTLLRQGLILYPNGIENSTLPRSASVNQLPLRCCMMSWCWLVFSQPDTS